MKNRHKNISQIIERLPLHRQLNETQAMLLKITPIWRQWLENHLPKNQSSEDPSPRLVNNSPEPINNSPELIDISTDTLNINCFSSVQASHIKHQQTSLLNALNNAGFCNIRRIKVSMSLMSPEPNKSLQPNNQSTPNQQQRSKPSTTSIQAIEHCGTKTDNTQLSESLRRLADTLNKTL